MAILLDTNILVRQADQLDKLYPVAVKAISVLHRRGEILHITPQNLIEFRNVATRPKGGLNGLGFSMAEAELHSLMFESQFQLLQDTPDVFPAWKAIVAAVGIIGKQVHDARLVAVCHAHGVSHILTFNEPHFTRMAGIGPGLIMLHPSKV